MNFLSLTFLLFFPITLLVSMLCPKQWQNIILLAANCVFYLWSNPLIGIFLLAATTTAWLCGLGISRYPQRKHMLTGLTMVVCFGMLFAFKYLDFTASALLRKTVSFGWVLPVGISFYSFALVGYVFDVSGGRLEAEKNPVIFAAFASFFPAILSGPISRARDLLPQLHKPRVWNSDSFRTGLWRFVLGAAKKLVVANLLANAVDLVYAAPEAYSSGVWLLTAILYALQIYVDFAAYSDMAIGTGMMLGFSMQENFRAPYLSRDVKTFWKKWHISLTSWFREYLYFPLGGSRKGKWRTRLNVLIVFLVSGIWHGAGWTFLIWGGLNGLFQVAGSMTLPARKKAWKFLHISENSPVLVFGQVVITFMLMAAAWIFFRADNLQQAFWICRRILLIFRDGFGSMASILTARQWWVLGIGLVLILLEDVRITRNRPAFVLEHPYCCWPVMAVLVFVLLLYGQYGPGFNASDFVYFKF